MNNATREEFIRKQAFWGNLARLGLTGSSKLFGSLKSLAKIHGGLSLFTGVGEGLSAEGTLQDKLIAGSKAFGKEFIDPRSMFRNIVGYGVAPALFAKGVGAAGKSMLYKNPSSWLGKKFLKQDTLLAKALKEVKSKPTDKNFLTDLSSSIKKMENDPSRSFVNEYVRGDRAGLITNMGVGMAVSPLLEPILTGTSKDKYEMAEQKLEGKYPIYL